MIVNKSRDVDIPIFITKNIFTNDINLIKGNSAILNSVKNLVLTTIGERRFNFNLGTIVYNELFNTFTGNYNEEIVQLKNSIFLTLSNYEPRIEDTRVIVIYDDTNDAINIAITYKNVGSTEIQTINIAL